MAVGDDRPLPARLKVPLSRELDRIELLLERIKAVVAERDALPGAEHCVMLVPAAMLLDISGPCGA
jgi:hypothetical protein